VVTGEYVLAMCRTFCGLCSNFTHETLACSIWYMHGTTVKVIYNNNDRFVH